MDSIKKIVVFGFLVWLVPFLISFLVFPFRENYRAFFESVMALVLAVVAVIFSVLYFKKAENNYFSDGVKIGISWYLISLFIDLSLFLPPSQMQMSLSEYFQDIGLTYLIIPVITIGMGYLMEFKFFNIKK